MRRGFKAEAECVAEALRRDLGVGPPERLDPFALAKGVGAEVRCADELTDRAKLETLEELQPGAFSARTLTIGDRHVIVYSPLASPGRTSSDIGLYANEWGERVRSRGGWGLLGQLTPPAWSSTRSR